MIKHVARKRGKVPAAPDHIPNVKRGITPVRRISYRVIRYRRSVTERLMNVKSYETIVLKHLYLQLSSKNLHIQTLLDKKGEKLEFQVLDSPFHSLDT